MGRAGRRRAVAPAGVKDNLRRRYVAAAFDRFPSAGMPKVYTYEADEDDIRRIMQMYAEAARRAIDAGFDILYVHGAAGVLPRPCALAPFQPAHRRLWRLASRTAPGFWIEMLETHARGGRRAMRGRDAASPSTISPGPGAWRLQDEGLRFVELVTRQGLRRPLGRHHRRLWRGSGARIPARRASTRATTRRPGTREVKRIAKVPVVGVGRFTDPDEMVRVVQVRPARHHRLRAALDRRSLAAAQDRRGPRRGHLRMHRLQHLHLALRISAAPSSARRTRRRWRSIAAAGIRSASRRPRAPGDGAGGGRRPGGAGMRPGARRCAATGASRARPRRRWAGICATSSGCRGWPNGAGSSPIARAS